MLKEHYKGFRLKPEMPELKLLCNSSPLCLCIMILSNYIIIYCFHKTSASFSAQLMDSAQLMSSYSIFSFLLIVQCVAHALFTAH